MFEKEMVAKMIVTVVVLVVVPVVVVVIVVLAGFFVQFFRGATNCQVQRIYCQLWGKGL